jgi:cytochrome c553
LKEFLMQTMKLMRFGALLSAATLALMPLQANAQGQAIPPTTTGQPNAGSQTTAAIVAPAWAYPVADKEQPPGPDENEIRQAPGSSRTYTRKQIDNLFNPPIWYPDQAVGMPKVVHSGAPPGVRACAACHLQSGQGHPESGHISGLPVAYFLRQIQDYRDGNRIDKVWMTNMAKAMSYEDAAAAADWFSKLKPIKWVRVIETDTIPKSYFNKSRKRLPLSDGSTEPLGDRIAEFPEDPVRVLDRDPNSGFIAYVPKGSLALGEKLVKDGAGRTLACAACHGDKLQGNAEIPRIAGISALYTVRQMFAFKTEERKGIFAEQMKPVVAELQEKDIIAVAAYLASLDP